MFLELPSIPTQNRHLHCIISPRSHHIETLKRHNSFRGNWVDQGRQQMFKIQVHSATKGHYSDKQKQDTRLKQKDFQDKIDSLTLPFHMLLNSKSHHIGYSRSFSSEFSNSNNKFYSFKSIRQDKCRQNNLQGKVVKSTKVNPEKQKSFRKKVIEHLDDIKTVQSKNSPRQSLNSLTSPQIQQSQIIMRGADLYDDLMKQNGIQESKLFPGNKTANSIYQTPEIRKQLCQSTYIVNKMNTVKGNCLTEPKKTDKLQHDSPVSIHKNTNCFFRYLAPRVDQNRFSFLKTKNLERK